MATKLILIEGIPGSGKSTFARKIAQWYQNRGVAVNLYIEGQSHPADLGWNACVPAALYENLLEKYEPLRAKIVEKTVFEADTAIIAYTLVETDDKNFYKELAAYEVYDGRVSDDVFFNRHYDRWRAFAHSAASKNELNIFECAFMQNHVNELLFWRNADEHTVISHHNKLIDMVKCLSPLVIYLSQSDIRETIQRIARERIYKDNGNWIDHCIAYCENSPYGKRNGIKGFDGAMQIFTIRKQLEMKILTQLPAPHIVINNDDYNWDSAWSRIETYLLEQTGYRSQDHGL
ncbi:MAG: thymidylate kinase [Oscillospiraceae bacterium]|nr:thymidylate kinase [Oscillospiraceae bacterium]